MGCIPKHTSDLLGLGYPLPLSNSISLANLKEDSSSASGVIGCPIDLRFGDHGVHYMFQVGARIDQRNLAWFHCFYPHYYVCAILKSQCLTPPHEGYILQHLMNSWWNPLLLLEIPKLRGREDPGCISAHGPCRGPSPQTK